MNNGEAKPKTIIITSSVPEEGKSTVALYLAATLARGNSRVLLVDGDMRRGTLHTFFGAAGNPGLAEVLDDEIVHRPLLTFGFRDGLIGAPDVVSHRAIRSRE